MKETQIWDFKSHVCESLKSEVGSKQTQTGSHKDQTGSTQPAFLRSVSESNRLRVDSERVMAISWSGVSTRKKCKSGPLQCHIPQRYTIT